MMFPILIPVSVAPVSYFFCAKALPPITVTASAAADSVARCLRRFIIPASLLQLICVGLSDQFLDLSVDHVNQLPRSVRQQEDYGKDEHAEHGVRETLGDLLGDVRNEHDECRSGERAGQPADASDHHAEEQGNG